MTRFGTEVKRAFGVVLFVATCLVSGCGTRVSLGEMEIDEAGATEPNDASVPPDAPATIDSGTAADADAAVDAKPVFDAAPDGGYLPCAGKACGDDCKLCDPKEIGCVETAVIKLCNAAGQCTADVPSC